MRMTYDNPYIGVAASNTGKLSALGQMFEGMIGYAGQGASAMAAMAGVDRSARAAQAGAQAAQQYQASRGAALREASRMGVDPNSGRFAGLQQKWALAEAAARSGAMDAAWQAADSESFTRSSQLAGLGAQFGGMALNAASAAASNDRSAASLYSDALRMQYGVDKDKAEGRGYRDTIEPVPQRVNVTDWADVAGTADARITNGDEARAYQAARDAARRKPATLRP